MIYFFAFGTLVLLILTFQDIKKQMVDSRPNWLMHGVALSLMTHFTNYNLLLVLILIIAFFLLKPYLSKWIGKGDLTALHWIIYGTAIISPYVTGIFCVLFSIITVIYGMLKLFFFGKNKMVTPFYPVILCSFALTGLLYVMGYLPYFIYFP